MVLHCQICNKEFKTKIGLKKHNDKNNCIINNINDLDNSLNNLSINYSSNDLVIENTNNITTNTITNTKKINIDLNNINIIKPLIKWVGGKSKLLDKLYNDFPYEFNNYHELFLGGGSVLLGILSLKKENLIKINGKINAYDLNETLIYLYKNIQNNHEVLFQEIDKLIKDLNLCPTEGVVNRKANNINDAKICKENYYYWIRKSYNNLSNEEKRSCIGSAMFIFLNKTCFRGLYRMGPNGFNVPYGNYNSPEIINKEHLDLIHDLIQEVNFECLNYKDAYLKIQKDDFIYMDPPYAPENKNSFVGYNEDGFDIEEHKNLFKLCNELNNKNIKFMMSNSDVELVRNNFVHSNYNIKTIECRRAINAKKPDSKTNEVVIVNY